LVRRIALVPKSRIDSNFLYLLSKIFVVGGAALVVGGAVVVLHTSFFVGIELLGVLVITGGYYMRRKASTFRRRFDWRDGHVAY
jgi:hypothetical protein